MLEGEKKKRNKKEKSSRNDESDGREKKVIPAASREEKSKIKKERTNTPSCLFLFCLARAFGGTGTLQLDFVRSNDFQAAC